MFARIHFNQVKMSLNDEHEHYIDVTISIKTELNSTTPFSMIRRETTCFRGTKSFTKIRRETMCCPAMNFIATTQCQT